MRDRIESLNIKGDCDFCGMADAFVYDFARNNSLQDSMLAIMGLYETADSSVGHMGHSMVYELTSRWHLLNLSEKTTAKLLDAMYRETSDDTFAGYDMESLLTGDVHLKTSEANAIPEHDWEKFANHLKYQNRFFVSFINTDELAKLISCTRTICKSGTVLTRARIASDAKGYAPGRDMGAPPAGLAGNGRINPVGISELYTTVGEDDLTDDTALHEIRAGMHDYVTFGKFTLNKTITVADLSKISEISPFDIDAEDLPLFAVNLEILDGMARDIARPMRRGDNPLEYIPSQYIAEFIKSLGEEQGGPYDGVMYSSTLKKNGVNLCLFAPEEYTCDTTYTKRVSEITYDVVD
ncbi:RES domain-containing protein [Bifidobacterium simiiventris]|uniref:RES domain-containing protein n=1 Tax=Bifidobacterium simiiventris TaxID=2834434 RepID=UPI001C55CB5E|nr:HEPN-associated N-terminal domain-containing protein [Bifidobacterium simiiventris]MBW3079636.1 RES domain-containing protein [Bifidobacterium simiiventris]